MWLSPDDLARWRALAKVEVARMLANCDPPLREGNFVSLERLNAARERKARVAELRARGMSVRQIEMRLGVGNSTVRRDLQEMRQCDH